MTYCSYYHQKIKLEVKVNSAYKPSGPSGQLLSVFSFSGMKQLGVFVKYLMYFPQYGMLGHHRVTSPQY